MERIIWSSAIAVMLVVVIIVWFAAAWVSQDWTAWDSSRTMSSSRSVGRTVFVPFMFFMPLAWLALPIFGIVCLIRWMSGAPRRGFRPSFGPSMVGCHNCGSWLKADWQVCPYCGQASKRKEDHNV